MARSNTFIRQILIDMMPEAMAQEHLRSHIIPTVIVNLNNGLDKLSDEDLVKRVRGIASCLTRLGASEAMFEMLQSVVVNVQTDEPAIIDDGHTSYDRDAILAHAIELTCGDRNKSYGPPYRNMSRTADFWSTYLGVTIQPHQVAGCMVLLKLARTTETFDHRDSYVDAAAYIGIAGECTQGDPNPQEKSDEA